MKNIFAMDLMKEHDDEDILFDGRKFITVETDSALLEESKKIMDAMEEDLNPSKKIKILKSILGWIAFITGIFLFCNLNLFSMKNLFVKELPLKICFLFCLILWISFNKMIITKSKKIVESQEYKKKIDRLNDIIFGIKKQLQIPEDAVQIDILTYPYKIENGKEKINILGYDNFPCYLYKKDGCLCIAGVEFRVSLPLENIDKVYKVNKKIPFTDWNKDKPYNDKEYKKYKIICNNIGIYFCKPYYVLRLKDSEEDYEMFIMPYDLDAYLDLLSEECIKVDEGKGNNK